MFGWAEQRSSQAFRTKCVQTHVRRLEIQSVSFFVKQFILRLFLWNVNQPMLNVFFLCYHGCRSAYTMTPSCLRSFTKQPAQPNSLSLQMPSSVSHQPWRATIKSKQNDFRVSSLSRYAVAYLLQRKFVLRSISTICASEQNGVLWWHSKGTE